MKKSRFSESQIIKAIKENEGGRRVEDTSRELGITLVLFTSGVRSTVAWTHPT